jgi:transmembrane sensor
MTEQGLSIEASSDRLAQATEWFFRLRSEQASVEDLTRFQCWLEEHGDNAGSYRNVSASWSAVAQHASAPEIMAERRDALENAQRAARGRWRADRPRGLRLAIATGFAGMAVAAIVGLWSQSSTDLYSTGVGERRTLTLIDGSIVTLDAKSRIRVDYRPKERLLSLEQGQARFDVAKDPTRPFRVRAGKETVVAIGTQFNVELVSGNVLVTMIEGHVAVTGVARGLQDVSSASGNFFTNSKKNPELSAWQRALSAASEPSVIELRAGEGLRVGRDGRATLEPKIDVARATAWQSGKLFFDHEPLASAAERVSRYSRLKIEVDPSVANVSVSGVFNTGDAHAFVEAIAAYFPVEISRIGSSEVLVTSRNSRAPSRSPSILGGADSGEPN